MRWHTYVAYDARIFPARLELDQMELAQSAQYLDDSSWIFLFDSRGILAVHFARSEPEVLAKCLAEVGLVMETPCVGNLADGAMARLVETQFATAMFQALDQHPLHQMLRLVGEKLMYVTPRQSDRLGNGLHVEIRIIDMSGGVLLDALPVIRLQGVIMCIAFGKRLHGNPRKLVVESDGTSQATASSVLASG